MIGIISDTHDNIPNIKKAVDIFKNRNMIEAKRLIYTAYTRAANLHPAGRITA